MSEGHAGVLYPRGQASHDVILQREGASFDFSYQAAIGGRCSQGDGFERFGVLSCLTRVAVVKYTVLSSQSKI